MSDDSAIGAVSATLQILLKDRMQIPPDLASRQDLNVTLGLPPADADGDDNTEAARVNLFLYRILESGPLKNQEIPGTGNPGAYGRPPLSLDLFYLLTTYGSRREGAGTNETLAHFLLGSAMRVLHDYPTFTESLETIHESPGTPILYESLRDAYEDLKITLEPVSLEDLSKVWTAISRPYRASAVYRVSVVQIESRLVRAYPRLVGEPPDAGPRVHTRTFRRPRIQKVRVRRPGDAAGTERTEPYARVGDTLILRGSNFNPDATTVLLGDVDATASITEVQPERLELTIPDEDDLTPGPLTVKAKTSVADLPEAGVPSNEAVFMLVPRVDAVVYVPLPPQVTVTGTRLHAEGLDGLAIVDDVLIRAEDYTAATPSAITFPLPAPLTPGAHTLRVRVNGAENVEAATVEVGP